MSAVIHFYVDSLIFAFSFTFGHYALDRYGGYGESIKPDLCLDEPNCMEKW